MNKEMKLDRVLDEAKIEIECVRVFPEELGKLVIQSRESGDVPLIAIQKTLNETRGIEYQIFFVKPYRTEEFWKEPSNPELWKTFGELIFKQEDLEKICREFRRMIDTHEKPGEPTVTFWKMTMKKPT